MSETAELVLGSFGAMQSAFLSVYLFLSKRRNTKNLLLTLFFLFITLRIVKSLLWVYLDQVPQWFLNLGFVAHSASGPLLFLYLIYFMRDKSWKGIHLLHFLPSAVLLLLLFYLNEANFWYKGGYSALLYQQLTYALLTLGLLVFSFGRRRREESLAKLANRDWLWLSVLVLGVFSIQLAYFSNYLLGLTPYLAGPVVYGVFVFAIAFFAVTERQTGSSEGQLVKYGNIHLEAKEFDRIRNRIETLMVAEKPYLEADFSLESLSELVGTARYIVSHVINKGFKTNFSDLINSYRVEEAKSKLSSDAFRNIKIAQIAYECGFNSLSSFNASFKKHTGTTPSYFRDHQS
ncbi:helix-turn-helix domain-containing protein [Poritiphilus flavus]|uniref:helix-turn-helix domain-containing protein n=1 Tax=Poritiphilus flavus TaxID=2697053 RepID=UPI001372F144|nr:AraC family transcriptional regulator [Poritiphilus flavus]